MGVSNNSVKTRILEVIHMVIGWSKGAERFINLDITN
jgi:hypothetical protein